MIGEDNRPKNLSAKGLRFIARFEGFRAMPYNDPANPPNATIGYGHLLHKGPVTLADNEHYPHGITQAKALILLGHDSANAAAAVYEDISVTLTQPEFDALVSFTFNCGVRAFTNSTLRDVINRHEFSHVPGELSRWIYAGSATLPLPGLLVRRRAESELFMHGTY